MPRAATPAAVLPVHYIRLISEQVRRMGADVPRWLERSGLREAQLEDASLTIPHPVFERLLLDALHATGEPALGLLVGERLIASTHGILGYAATQSGTVRQALELFERYTQLRTSLVAISHEVGPKKVRVHFRETQPLGEIRRPLLEAVVLSIKNVLDSISMGACQVEFVAFAMDAPQYAALARTLFACDVRWGQSWTGFALAASILDWPLRLADADAFREAEAICRRELDKLTANESHAARVRRLLLEKQNGLPSLEVTARLFHLTPRTLHRRLLEEGTSYREILEDVRHTLAVEHMKSGRFGIQEIAYTLGYSDLANFRRAFKRWESMPPSSYRAAVGERAETSGTRRGRALTR